MKKRIIALLMAAFMIVSMLPVAIMAEDDGDIADPVETDSIEKNPGVFYDNAEWVALDGTPIAYIGNNGPSGTYTTETNPVTMTVLFEVQGIRTPVTFGRVQWGTLGTGETTWIDSSNSGNYLMTTSFTVEEDGMYAVQFGFATLNWVGSTFGSVNSLRLFSGSRGVEFSSENTRATIRPVGFVEANVTYNVTFCNTDGTEIMNASGALTSGGTWTAKMEAVPALSDLYTSDVVPVKEETEEYRYEFAGWQTANGVAVDYATFTGKVYPRFEEIDKSQAVLKYVDGDDFVVAEQVVKVGDTPEALDLVPTKSSDADYTYAFSHWAINGEKVDLTTFKPDRDYTVAAAFVPVVKTKASVYEIDPVSFGGTGTYGIKLNRSDITTDALKPETTPITGGKVTVSTSGLTNEGATEFEISFDKVDEDGFTNAEFVLDETAGYAGKDAVSVSGTVTGDGAEAVVYDNKTTIVVGGQQVGQYYTADDESAVLLPNNMTGLKETKIWEGNVDLDAAGGVTFVFRATGIEEAMNASALRVSFTTTKNSNLNDMGGEYAYTNGWSDVTDENGNVDRALYVKMSEDGYYYVYISRKVLGMSTRNCDPIATINKVSLFAPGGDGYKKSAEASDNLASNTNDDAQVQLVAIVKENLEPTVTFMNGDEVIATQSYKYTDLKNTADYLMADKASDGSSYHFAKGVLITPEDLFEMTGKDLPVKESDIDKVTYEFDGWTDEDGNMVDGVYMSGNVYAHYSVVDNRTKYIVKFVNADGTVLEQKICAEGETPEYTGKIPLKASTEDRSYKFKNWDKDIEALPVTDKTDGEIDPTPVVYTATYDETVRTYDVYFYDEDGKTLLDEIHYINRGDAVATEVVPVKPATVQYTYTFDKWVDADKNDVDLTNITKDTIVYATYKSTVNQYTVTFLDEDGTELAKVTVDYGTAATTDAPVKAADEKYTYTFEKWDADTSSVVGDMTVTAVYSKEFTMFTDVKASAWYGDKVEYVINHGYMDGMGDGKFDPNGKTTRAQLVQVLYNMELRPNVDGLENPFTDVAEGQWYTAAIKWAYSKGIVAGMSPTTFEPNTPITRAQFCRILYGYSEKIHGYDTEIPKSSPVTIGIFKDKNSIPTWAQAEVKWCMYVGCISGYTESGVQYMKPNNNTTRAEMATILKLWDESDKLVVATPAE